MGAANHVEVKQSKGKDALAAVVPVPKDLPPKAAEKREPEKVLPLHLSFLQSLTMQFREALLNFVSMLSCKEIEQQENRLQVVIAFAGELPIGAVIHD